MLDTTTAGSATGGQRAAHSPTPVAFAGILDLVAGAGFVRTSGYLPGSQDVHIPAAQVRRHGLRRGDLVTGTATPPSPDQQSHAGQRDDGAHPDGQRDDGQRTDRQRRPQGRTQAGRTQAGRTQAGRAQTGRAQTGRAQTGRDRHRLLAGIDSVNGAEPATAAGRRQFETLVPLYPWQRLRLETGPRALTGRMIDLFMPLGKGQRALIPAPPRAGKTMVLQAIADAITRNHPECHLMMVLIDERPERSPTSSARCAAR
jgi:transcription termination factor Rho